MTRRTPLGVGLAIALALVPFSLQAQLTHRGVAREGRITETVSFVDAWEDGAGGPDADGTLDVLTVKEVDADSGRRVTAYLLLFGPWGHYLHAHDEDVATRGVPDSAFARTTARALDLDADGRKELLFIERSVATRIALDDTGRPAEDPGPYFADASASLRYLSREGGALVAHDLPADAGSPALKELLSRELGGALNAWLQLAVADEDFLRERYEQARYRLAVVREWAESQMSAREIAELGPRLPLAAPTPDDPAVLWLAATRRIGALPRWYQRR